MVTVDGRHADLDEVDLALLECVEDDFDVNLDELADELDLSRSAVHYRLNKLKEEGVVTGVTADLDPVSLDLDMVAITQVSVTHEAGYSEDIGTQLADLAGVEQVYYTMGDVDFVLVCRVQDRSQMNDVIEHIVAIDGVNETSSRFVMDEIETHPRVTPVLSEEMKSSLLDGDG
ncbi:MAG: Lrp/AsnC family transcriptional regulator [Haloarculaceae archaeon]